jgi:hypothetical protein
MLVNGTLGKAVIMRKVSTTVAVLAALAAGACGGSGGSQQSVQARPPSASAVESRWLRGLWANDIRETLGPVGLTCKGPVMENRTNVWTCEAGTPLVSYKVRFFGIAPGKIDYINAVVAQSGPAKDALPLRLFEALAGLRFEEADQAKAREWMRASIATGGTTAIGPARYKLSGDANRRVLDLKSADSEW